MNQRLTVPEERAGEPEVVARITQYLSTGGLFNPELANHVAVRDLLIDCREALIIIEEMNRQLREQNESVDAACAELEEAIAKKDAALRACVEALKQAKEDIEHWAGYASDYFREKHDFTADMDDCITAIAQAEKELK